MKRISGALIASMLVLSMAIGASVASAGKMNSNEVPEEVAAPEAESGSWTIMVYVAGDNNLEMQALLDMDEMELIGSSENVKIVVLLDTFELLTGTHWYVIDPADEAIDHVDLENGVNDCDCEEVLGGCPEGDLNMGDGKTLKDFIVTAAAHAPADNYMLVLWDHGGGWYGVCWDDSSVREEDARIDRLTVDEFGNAIRAAEAEAGIRFTVIGFDACLMAMVEVAYEICDLADYMLASVTGIPFDGWAYDLFLDDLILNPGMDATELADAVIAGYVEYYSLCAGEGLGGWTGVTLSLIDLTVIDDLAAAMDDLSYGLQELYESGEASRGSLIYAAEASTPALEMYGQQFAFSDVGVLATILADTFESISDEATTVAELAKLAVPEVMWVSQTSGGAFTTTGITVYFPCAYYYTYPDYAYETADEAAAAGELIYYGLNFTIDTNWDEFVFSMCPAMAE